MVENHAIKKKAQLIHSNSEEGSTENGTTQKKIKDEKSEENYKEWERENGKITMIEKINVIKIVFTIAQCF